MEENTLQNYSLKELRARYEEQRQGKESLLVLIDEAEIPESVYNSNAIENSTLTLLDTEKILLDMEVSRNLSLREVFEAKNLAQVTEYLRPTHGKKEFSLELILLLHKMLISNIEDGIAGRLRGPGEYVRVGKYIAPAPEQLQSLMTAAVTKYNSNVDLSPLVNIVRFHLEFEHIHPFCDGNGRIGRILINFQLQNAGFPPVILRNKEKQKYYEAIKMYDDKEIHSPMLKVFTKAMRESLHKRLAYLEGKKIMKLSEFAKINELGIHTLLNAAKRQTIPAFRERGTWKIGV
ncbi:MAG: Fic family protein [Candidatus Gracilibacteria bacterium]